MSEKHVFVCNRCGAEEPIRREEHLPIGWFKARVEKGTSTHAMKEGTYHFCKLKEMGDFFTQKARAGHGEAAQEAVA